MTDLTDILYSGRTDEELVRDPNVIANLEEVVMGWERHILKLIEIYLAKVCSLFEIYIVRNYTF